MFLWTAVLYFMQGGFLCHAVLFLIRFYKNGKITFLKAKLSALESVKLFSHVIAIYNLVILSVFSIKNFYQALNFANN